MFLDFVFAVLDACVLVVVGAGGDVLLLCYSISSCCGERWLR